MTEPVELTTSSSPQVTVIVVTYRSLDTIGAALDALQASFEAGLIETVIIDNASNDGTADWIVKHYPSVTIVRNFSNVGFGRGCNQGFKHVTTPYVLLLNPDAEIDLKAIKTLVRFMDKTPRAGICGPSVKEASGALQPAGGLPSPWKIMLRPLLPGWASRGQRQVIPGEAPSSTNWICGSVMLLRWTMVEEIGGFDPRFFLYFEETDLCYRAQKAGWEVWTVGEAVAEHVNAAAAKATKAPMMWGTISEHYFRSRLYYMIKHFGLPLAVAAELGELVFMFLRAALELMRGRHYLSLRPRLQAPILKLPQLPIDGTE